MSAGANVQAVHQTLDHAAAAKTMDVHAGLFGDDLHSLADRLDQLAVSGSARSMRARENLTPAIATGSAR
jgi:hypothetical protein